MRFPKAKLSKESITLMINKLQSVLRFFNYFFKAKRYKGHGVHSPFIYSFVREVLYAKDKKTNYIRIETYRKDLKKNKLQIKIEDFGAGSKILPTNYRKISQIARYSSIKKKYGRLLSRIIYYYKPQTVLELGTSLGISTLYLHLYLGTNSKLYTVEGASELVKIVSCNFRQLHINNVELINSKFESAIPELLSQKDSFDVVFFDGNHTKEATIHYFELCLAKTSDSSIFIFDDIYWSQGMQEAWEYIKTHEKTKVCIDLFQLGIVFFRKELSKQNFIIRY